MAAWALKDAEASAKEVFERAFAGEPQIVMRDGVPSLVIMAFADFEAATPKVASSPPTTITDKAEKTTNRPSLVELFASCPVDLSDLIEGRVGCDLPSAFDRAGGFNTGEYQ